MGISNFTDYWLMTLESTVIGLNGNRSMTNEDLGNQRTYFQRELIDKIANNKYSMNQENSITLINMSDSTYLIHNTKKSSDLSRKMHQLKLLSQEPNVIQTIRKAILSLKHRPNTNMRLRIVLIIDSSKIFSDVEKNEMTNITSNIKKLKIGIDIILIGIGDQEKEFLTAFIEACTGPDDMW